MYRRMRRNICVVGVALWMIAAPALWAQQNNPAPPAKPGAKGGQQEAQQKKAPKSKLKLYGSFEEWLQDMMKPIPVNKKTIVRLNDEYAYPHPAMALKMKIVKEDADTVWLQFPPPEDPDSPLHKVWLQRQNDETQIAWKAHGRPKDYFVDFYNPAVPPPSVDELSYELLGDSGLPTSGLWQMDGQFIDMNGDGHLDLVVPGARKTFLPPSIFLGDGAGRFILWKDVKWPTRQGVVWDYGSPRVTDLDKDGNLDIVLAIHLKAQWVFYGDGQGDFTRCERLPSPDPRLYTRSVAVADFNGDGWRDLAFVAELGFDLSTQQPLSVPSIWILENLQGKGWKVHSEDFPRKFQADYIDAADVDGDGRPDLVLSSSASDWRIPVMFNAIKADKWQWRALGLDQILSLSFHFQVLPFEPPSGKRGGTVAGVFEQFALMGGETATSLPELKNEVRAGVVRYTFDTKGHTWIPKPTVLTDQRDPFWRLAVGDLNGDGLPDMVAVKKSGGLDLLLQKKNGDVVLERSPELQKDLPGRVYSVQILDVNHDGRNDLVIMGADKDKQPGGFRVWLNEAPTDG